MLDRNLLDTAKGIPVNGIVQNCSNVGNILIKNETMSGKVLKCV